MDIIGLSSTTVKLSNSVKKGKIKSITPFNAIQGHRGRYQSKARLIVIDILSRTVSELSQLIVQILDTLRF